jgi:hypothetical protein
MLAILLRLAASFALPRNVSTTMQTLCVYNMTCTWVFAAECLMYAGCHCVQLHAVHVDDDANKIESRSHEGVEESVIIGHQKGSTDAEDSAIHATATKKQAKSKTAKTTAKAAKHELASAGDALVSRPTRCTVLLELNISSTHLP